LHLRFDGSDALSVNYDEPSIMTTLDIATPFLGDSPVASPDVNKLLREQIVPVILTSDVDVAVDMK
jgi:hypothetical protein